MDAVEGADLLARLVDDPSVVGCARGCCRLGCKNGQLGLWALGAKGGGEDGTFDELLVGDDVEVERTQREECVHAIVPIARVLRARVAKERQPHQGSAAGERACCLQRAQLVVVQVEHPQRLEPGPIVRRRQRRDAIVRQVELLQPAARKQRQGNAV